MTGANFSSEFVRCRLGLCGAAARFFSDAERDVITGPSLIPVFYWQRSPAALYTLFRYPTLPAMSIRQGRSLLSVQLAPLVPSAPSVRLLPSLPLVPWALLVLPLQSIRWVLAAPWRQWNPRARRGLLLLLVPACLGVRKVLALRLSTRCQS